MHCLLVGWIFSKSREKRQRERAKTHQLPVSMSGESWLPVYLYLTFQRKGAFFI